MHILDWNDLSHFCNLVLTTQFDDLRDLQTFKEFQMSVNESHIIHADQKSLFPDDIDRTNLFVELHIKSSSENQTVCLLFNDVNHTFFALQKIYSVEDKLSPYRDRFRLLSDAIDIMESFALSMDIDTLDANFGDMQVNSSLSLNNLKHLNID